MSLIIVFIIELNKKKVVCTKYYLLSPRHRFNPIMNRCLRYHYCPPHYSAYIIINSTETTTRRAIIKSRTRGKMDKIEDEYELIVINNFNAFNYIVLYCIV